MEARAALAVVAATLAWACDVAGAAEAVPGAARQQMLVRLVRQDCGSCHGMRLTGGLGPALTPEALHDRPLESLVATTLHGRAGTPMPGWASMLSESDARWIAAQLRAGFPEEAKGTAK